VTADKTKYMVMPGDLNAGWSHNIKIDNSSFEKVEEFKCLGRTLTNQNPIWEVFKSRLMSGNACYHLVQNLLSTSLPSTNLKIEIYRTIILPVVLYGCIGRSHWGRNMGWACLRVGCWGEYLGLRGMSEQGNGENYIMRSLMK